METIRFSDRFIRVVTEHFGSDMSPRLSEALQEGDYEFVATFLRGSRKPCPTWESLATVDFFSLKVEAARQIELKEICHQFYDQLAAYSLPAYQYV